MTAIFLHGLESSSKGHKARWLREHFPVVVTPDFTGSLGNRMKKLNIVLAKKEELLLVGSSFGGLMATIYAQENNSRVRKVILLAPALNFPDFSPYLGKKTSVPAQLYIGRQDIVCPADRVVQAAQNIFTHLSVHVSDDDHLLRDTFTTIDWAELIRN
jgi:predicted esterase YcpF (UPF0227 family)